MAPPTVSRDKTSQGRDAPTRVRKQQQRAAEAHSNVQQQHQLTASGTPTAIRSLADQMPLLSEGAGRNRATSVGSWRKVAITIATLQGAVSGEMQARQQLAVSIGDSITLVRKMVTSENEGTAYAGPDAFQERDYPTVSRSCGTETPVQTPWKTRGVKCATASGSGSTGTPARTPRRLPATRFASRPHLGSYPLLLLRGLLPLWLRSRG